MGDQRAGQPNVEGGDGKGQQFVLEQVHAHDGGGDILVADGDEGASPVGAEQVDGGDGGDDNQSPDQPVEIEITAHFDAEEHGGGDYQSVHAAGHDFPVGDDPQDDDLRGQGGNGEVESF